MHGQGRSAFIVFCLSESVWEYVMAWQAHGHVKNRFHTWWREGAIVRGEHIEHIAVARHAELITRASHAHAPYVAMDGSRGLAIVDEDHACQLL